MLEKPDVDDALIIACLQADYGLPIAHIAFLPLGADLNTAVYRAVARDGTPYFVKLRRGVFDETAVALPKFLSDSGIPQIIAPLETGAGRLWADMGEFKVILYPFVEGRNGYEVDLSDRQWLELGAALKRIHTTAPPPALARCIPRENYSPYWRERVRMFLERIEAGSFAEPVAADMAAYLRAKREAILDLVGRAERGAQALRARAPEFVVCHSDVHAGNVLIAANDCVYIVDWDNPILAPKERDLMYVGGGQMGNWRTPAEEADLFYRGYGQTEIDPAAVAYYRYERIVQDIAVYCEQLLATTEGGEDREQSLRYLKSNFLPGGVLEIAYRSETLPQSTELSC